MWREKAYARLFTACIAWPEEQTDNTQCQISEHISEVIWRQLCSLSFKYFLQHAGSACLSYANVIKGCQFASKIHTSFNSFPNFRTAFASVERICFSSVKDKIQVVNIDKIINFREMCKPPWTKQPALWSSGFFITYPFGAAFYSGAPAARRSV